MANPLSHVGQTARPEGSQQQQEQPSQNQQQQQGMPSPGFAPQSNADSQPQQSGDVSQHPQQQQADYSHMSDEHKRVRERQQHMVDSEDDPASDANTASANHPNDE